MKSDYTTYTAEELLDDDFFLESTLHPTDENRLFWSTLAQTDTRLAHEIEIARHLIKTIRLNPSSLPESEVKQLWSQILTENTRFDRQKSIIRFKTKWSVAATILILIASSVAYWISVQQFGLDTIENVKIPEEVAVDVQLVLSEKKQVAIDGKESELTYDGKGAVNIKSPYAVVVEKIEKKLAKTEYNQLIVPAGRRSSIIFEDGTKVWVNARSRVVYPSTFGDKIREIYVEGEIYLEVVRDENKPFVVKTNKMQVKVLGTAFNVSAYLDETAQQVVLVKGKVEVNTKEKDKKVLIPNEKLTYADRQLVVQTVNVEDYTAWKDGFYLFHSESLGNVLDKLSKYYGKEIHYNVLLEDMKCSGKLDLKEDIQSVFMALQKAAPILVVNENESIYIDVEPKIDTHDGHVE